MTAASLGKGFVLYHSAALEANPSFFRLTYRWPGNRSAESSRSSAAKSRKIEPRGPRGFCGDGKSRWVSRPRLMTTAFLDRGSVSDYPAAVEGTSESLPMAFSQLCV